MKNVIYLLFIILGFGVRAQAQTPYVIYENFEIRSSEQMYLDPAIGKKYDLKNLVDQDLRTAWVYEKMLPSGAENDQKCESISLTISFPIEIEINSIQLANGYLKSQNLYQANNRTKSFKLKFSDKSELNLNCQDTFGLQSFALSKKSRFVIIEISDWIVGDKYNDHCISEIKLISNGKNILTPSGYRIENKAGWYSSDLVTFSESNSIDLATFEAINGLTDPMITEDRKYIMYHSNSDGCQTEIIDSEKQKSTDLGSHMFNNKLCPKEWISNHELLVKKMDDNYYELEEEEFIFNILTKQLRKR